MPTKKEKTVQVQFIRPDPDRLDLVEEVRVNTNSKQILLTPLQVIFLAEEFDRKAGTVKVLGRFVLLPPTAGKLFSSLARALLNTDRPTIKESMRNILKSLEPDGRQYLIDAFQDAVNQAGEKTP